MNRRQFGLLRNVLCSPLRDSSLSFKTPLHVPQGGSPARKASGNAPPRSPRLNRTWISHASTGVQCSRQTSNASHGGGDDHASSGAGRSTREGTRDSESVSVRMDEMVSNVTARSRRLLNDWTGYALVENLNKATEEQSQTLNHLQRRARTASAAYPLAVKNHASCLREINDHQIRTRIRTSHDAEVLAELYKAETSAEEIVTSTQATAKEAEDAATEAGIMYRELIQKARHEEQLWRDQIQYWSTWGTLILVGSNLLLWCVMEPWRRRRMVREIRNDIREFREEEGRGREGLVRDLVRLWPGRGGAGWETGGEGLTGTAAAATDGPTAPHADESRPASIDTTAGSSPPRLIDVIRSVARHPLNGDAVVSDLRPIDFTTLVAGAAAAGCVVTASVAVTLLTHR